MDTISNQPAKQPIYTLQRLYFEAKAILEKYALSIDGYRLEVEFNIKDNKEGAPEMKAYIRYSPESYASKDPWITSSLSVTPAAALNQFEEKVQEHLGNRISERVAIELEN
jgi:hypothetical protein